MLALAGGEHTHEAKEPFASRGEALPYSLHADSINLWRHTGHWLFDSPDVIEQVAREQSILTATCNKQRHEEQI